MQYNCKNYLAELRGRLQSAHDVARQKLISSKEKSKDYYDKGSETFEIHIGQKLLRFFFMKLYVGKYLRNRAPSTLAHTKCWQ